MNIFYTRFPARKKISVQITAVKVVPAASGKIFQVRSVFRVAVIRTGTVLLKIALCVRYLMKISVRLPLISCADAFAGIPILSLLPDRLGFVGTTPIPE